MNVLITGAARGIGAESARRLAAKGHSVALVGLEPEQLEAVAVSCGRGAFALEADVTDGEAIRRAIDEAAARLGGLDAVIANAGVATQGLLRHVEPDRFAQQIDVNLVGTFRTVHAAAPHLVERRGYLLIVASVAAILHGPVLGAYAASKAGTEALANSLRVELKHLGVDVGCGYFSWIDTDMVRGGDEAPAFRRLRQAMKPPFHKTHPVGAAADAIVEGVEQRRRIVAAPRWVRAFLPLRALIQRVAERDSRAVMPELEQIDAADRARRGEQAHAPVGAGGAAVDGSVSERSSL
jgi:NAD(P)-dependent dehydrogenase (short-subunit alcohol dehydrogenase family)